MKVIALLPQPVNPKEFLAITCKADSPGPMKVPAEQLKNILGITDVTYVRGQHALGVVDSSLA
jgi:NAD dependent epimerase/dehydratase family enzyme